MGVRGRIEDGAGPSNIRRTNPEFYYSEGVQYQLIDTKLEQGQQQWG